MSYDIIYIKHVNKNDCWNIVLSLCLKKHYDLVRYEYRDLKSKDGSMSNINIRSVLLANGFIFKRISDMNNIVTLEEILNKYSDRELVIGTIIKDIGLAHLSYYKDGLYYTTPNTANSENEVVEIYYKEKNNE